MGEIECRHNGITVHPPNLPLRFKRLIYWTSPSSVLSNTLKVGTPTQYTHTHTHCLTPPTHTHSTRQYSHRDWRIQGNCVRFFSMITLDVVKCIEEQSDRKSVVLFGIEVNTCNRYMYIFDLHKILIICNFIVIVCISHQNYSSTNESARSYNDCTSKKCISWGKVHSKYEVTCGLYKYVCSIVRYTNIPRSLSNL